MSAYSAIGAFQGLLWLTQFVTARGVLIRTPHRSVQRTASNITGRHDRTNPPASQLAAGILQNQGKAQPASAPGPGAIA
jgi:hypothetical protein